MFRSRCAILAALAIQALAAEAAFPADSPGLLNGDFERRFYYGDPVHWKLSGSACKLDSETKHGGFHSLRISNPEPASSTAESDPVELAVGHIYKLSAWVRTERASSDPIARYPTAVPACLTMGSFPFTNHSPAAGANTGWTRVETTFVATMARDRVRLHLGYNGTATGSAWFDDVELAEVTDIRQFIAPETVRWAGRGYRFDDKGWIFVHVEGAPYERGYQFGYLVSAEIVEYITKLGNLENAKDWVAGWNAIRLMTDAVYFRKYDEEYLTEMRGTAEGAARAGAKLDGRALDMLDIVAVNSAIDISQMKSAMGATPNALSGRSFLTAEEEMDIPDDRHKCSSFIATSPATADGRLVFGQIFMWNGYTGVHFNVLCDVEPATGHRFVYQTFPGGIHSGTDFYINDSGLMIGETTVAQTPWNIEGTPQSNRIRKAIQYASSIDEAAGILREKNNGMYTNDWPMGDVKTNEGAIFLLGTNKDKLWRTTDTPAPFGTPGFLWSNNNNRDPEVRKEYAVQPDDAPFDLIFGAWNRDIAFWSFYQKMKGKIDAIAGVNLWASSPINRAHACDGKITTSEMAEKLVFMAHFGKVTLREKFPEKGNRRMPDLPGAVPHLTLGYSTASPIVITERLAGIREESVRLAGEKAEDPEVVLADVLDHYKVEKKELWRGTVLPASERENWFVSGSAAYWQLLHGLPEKNEDAAKKLSDELAGLNNRLLYVLSREADLAPSAAERVYDRYGPYQIPRIKGAFLLHQLRLLLGTPRFLTLMRDLHDRFRQNELDTETLVRFLNEKTGRDLRAFVTQWTEREGLPDLKPAVSVRRAGKVWKMSLSVAQEGEPYHLLGCVEVEAGGKRLYKPIELKGRNWSVEMTFAEQPIRAVFNAGWDFPVRHPRFYTWANVVDEFHDLKIVYGTSRQIEANHTLATRWQTTLADAYVEILPPLVKDCELDAEEAADSDLIVLGSKEDNSLVARIAEKLPLEAGKNFFRWNGRLYARPDDGLFLVVPNPYNQKRALYLVYANSALQLYQMTKSYTQGIQSWAVFKGDKIEAQGPHAIEAFEFGRLDAHPAR